MDENTGKTQGNTKLNDEMNSAGADNGTSGSETKSSSHPFFKNKKVMLIVGIVGAVLLVLSLWLFLLADQKETQDKAEEVLFTINDQEYTEDDISDHLYFLEPSLEDREEAIEVIREALVYKVTAEEFDVEVTEAELEAKVESLPAYEPAVLEDNAWVRLLATRLVVEDKISAMTADDAEGYIFTYYFGQLVDPFVDEDMPEDMRLPNQGDEEAIEQDRQYAREKAEEHRQLLADGAATPDEVYEMNMSDERLHYRYILPNEEDSWTQQFGSSEGVDWRDEVNIRPNIEFIESQTKTGEPSDIQTGQVSYVEDDDMYDAYYFFTYLTQAGGKASGMLEMLSSNGVSHDF